MPSVTNASAMTFFIVSVSLRRCSLAATRPKSQERIFHETKKRRCIRRTRFNGVRERIKPNGAQLASRRRTPLLPRAKSDATTRFGVKDSWRVTYGRPRRNDHLRGVGYTACGSVCEFVVSGVTCSATFCNAIVQQLDCDVL